MTCNNNSDCKFGASCNKNQFNNSKRCKCKWQTYQCSKYAESDFDGIILLANSSGKIIPDEISYQHKTYCEVAKYSCMINSGILFNACYSEDEDDCYNSFVSPGLTKRLAKRENRGLRTFNRVCQMDTLSFCNYNGICLEKLVQNEKGTSHVIAKYCRCQREFDGPRCARTVTEESVNNDFMNKMIQIDSKVDRKTE